MGHMEKETQNDSINHIVVYFVKSFFYMAFCFSNKSIGTRLQFFTDGHTLLNWAILKALSWYSNIGIILDWYHHRKKMQRKAEFGNERSRNSK